MDQRNMMKQLQQVQQKMVKAQEELANETVTATAGGGAVSIVMNGHNEVMSVTIDKDFVDPDDVEMLQDTMLVAFNEATEKAKQMAEKKMSAITGGLSLPGMF